MMKYALVTTLAIFTLSGCYSFKSSVISGDIETFYVGRFQNQASNAPAAIEQTFSEALKTKIARESRLNFSEEQPDIEFTGSISTYIVTSVAPQAGERTAFNRLEVSIQVEYTNTLDEELSWKNNFRHFQDFASDQNLLDVQDDLITAIFDQILEDIFNKAFANW